MGDSKKVILGMYNQVRTQGGSEDPSLLAISMVQYSRRIFTILYESDVPYIFQKLLGNHVKQSVMRCTTLKINSVVTGHPYSTNVTGGETG